MFFKFRIDLSTKTWKSQRGREKKRMTLELSWQYKPVSRNTSDIFGYEKCLCQIEVQFIEWGTCVSVTFFFNEQRNKVAIGLSSPFWSFTTCLSIKHEQLVIWTWWFHSNLRKCLKHSKIYCQIFQSMKLQMINKEVFSSNLYPQEAKCK